MQSAFAHALCSSNIYEGEENEGLNGIDRFEHLDQIERSGKHTTGLIRSLSYAEEEHLCEVVHLRIFTNSPEDEDRDLLPGEEEDYSTLRTHYKDWEENDRVKTYSYRSEGVWQDGFDMNGQVPAHIISEMLEKSGISYTSWSGRGMIINKDVYDILRRWRDEHVSSGIRDI